MTKSAFILAGGKGTRLSPLINHLPKPIAPVNGKPFLWLLLNQLKTAGIENVVLLTGYKAPLIEEACGDGRQFGLNISYSVETAPLGTAGCLLPARALLKDDSFLLLNGDTFLETDLTPVLNADLSQNLGAIGVMPVDDTARFGSVVFDPVSGQITVLREKAATGPGFVNAGIYHLSRRIFDFIPGPGRFVSLEEETFPQTLGSGRRLLAQPLSGNFCDIGIPTSYANFNAGVTLDRELPPEHRWVKPIMVALLTGSRIAVVGEYAAPPALSGIRRFLSGKADVIEGNLEQLEDFSGRDLLIAGGAVPPGAIRCQRLVLESAMGSEPQVTEVLENTWRHLEISKGFVTTL